MMEKFLKVCIEYLIHTMVISLDELANDDDTHDTKLQDNDTNEESPGSLHHVSLHGPHDGHDSHQDIENLDTTEIISQDTTPEI